MENSNMLENDELNEFDSSYVISSCLKKHLETQEKWDKYYLYLFAYKRKISERTWYSLIIFLSKKNGINLKISRDPRTDFIYGANKVPQIIQGFIEKCCTNGRIVE
jgi:hypothetical protein